MPTIDAVLTRAASAVPDRIAVREWESGRAVTYRMLDDWATAFAMHLVALELNDGKAVGIHLPNCAEFLVAQFGSVRCGAVAAYVNYRLIPEEAARQLKLAEVCTIVTTPERATAFRADAALAHAEYVIVGSEDGPQAIRSILTRERVKPVQLPYIVEDADAIIRFTSGSTGDPKGVVVSHRAWIIRALSLLAEEITVEDGSMTMVLGLLSHHATLFVLPTFLRHGTLLVFDHFDIDRTADALAELPVARAQMVPTMLKMFLGHPRGREGLRTSSLRQIIYGGSPIEPSAIADALELMPRCDFVQTYGSHEVGSVSHLGGADHRNPALRASAGQVFLAASVRTRPIPGTDLGEIEVKAPWMPHARITANGREPIREEWIPTGDLGEVRDGYVFLRDRANDVIISGGFNVYPMEVERVINEFPGVVTSAVVSEPDLKWGERVVAFIVLKEAAAFHEDELRMHCRTHLTGFKIPKEFRQIDQVPLNPNGKPDRRRLSDPLWHQQERRIN
jgi:acyl-CoA synthetase (AMP-forming)/AMP-acid ligase II